MSRLSIELSDELRAKAESRAAEGGHPSLEAYVHSLLRADTGGHQDFGAPSRQTFGDDDAVLAAMLREGLASGPAAELTDADWERKRQRLIDARGPRPPHITPSNSRARSDSGRRLIAWAAESRAATARR